jgi:hypothetical protein
MEDKALVVVQCDDRSPGQPHCYFALAGELGSTIRAGRHQRRGGLAVGPGVVAGVSSD